MRREEGRIQARGNEASDLNDLMRNSILTRVATTEDMAVVLLDEIERSLPSLTPRAALVLVKHRKDEQRHADMLTRRMAELGLPTTRSQERCEQLKALYDDMAPVSTSDKYQVLQIIEETAAKNYAEIAEWLRPIDPESATLFDSMVHDEAAHIRYCEAATRELGGAPRLTRYRDIYAHPIEVYDHAKHFEEINAWGAPLDPDGLGAGLIIRERCCGFVGVIGGTRTCYLYGLRANPSASQVTRGLSLLRLHRSMVDQIRRAGFTHCVTETSNPVVERVWSEKHGFKRSSAVLLEGKL